jgi:hypothetical protein
MIYDFSTIQQCEISETALNKIIAAYKMHGLDFLMGKQMHERMPAKQSQ